MLADYPLIIGFGKIKKVMRRMRIGLVSRTDIVRPIDFSSKLLRYMLDRGLEVYVEEDFYRRIPESIASKVNTPLPSGDVLDLLIVVGGDGTLLKTLQGIKGSVPPLLTVRMGRYGFLMEAEPEEAYDYIEYFVSGKYRLKWRSRIVAYFRGLQLPPVLNEYAIFASQGKMAKFSISRGDKELYVVSSDGILVSTTSGSTAYALSAGGPIIDEHLDVMLVVPINSFHLHVKPVVLPVDVVLKIRVVGGRYGATVYADGVETALLKLGQEIVIKHYDRVPFVCMKDDYYSRIKRRVTVDP